MVAHATPAPSARPTTRASVHKQQNSHRVPLSNATNRSGLAHPTKRSLSKRTQQKDSGGIFTDLGKIFTDAAKPLFEVFDDVAATTRRAAAAAADVVKPVFEPIAEDEVLDAMEPDASGPTTRAASATAAAAAAAAAASSHEPTATSKPAPGADAFAQQVTARRAAVERQRAENERMKMEEEKIRDRKQQDLERAKKQAENAKEARSKAAADAKAKAATARAEAKAAAARAREAKERLEKEQARREAEAKARAKERAKEDAAKMRDFERREREQKQKEREQRARQQQRKEAERKRSTGHNESKANAGAKANAGGQWGAGGGFRPPPRQPPPRQPPPRRGSSAPPGKARGGANPKMGGPPMPPTLAQRVNAVLSSVHERLSKGDQSGAKAEIARGRELAIKDPRLAMAGLTEAKFAELEDTVDSMPAAALQVLKYATFSPFSAIGIPKLARARVLNTVNKRAMLKGYRRLAMQLHPDKCDHEYANPAMQALNQAYEKTQIDPNAKPPPKRR